MKINKKRKRLDISLNKSSRRFCMDFESLSGDDEYQILRPSTTKELCPVLEP